MISKEWSCDLCKQVITRDPKHADSFTNTHATYSGTKCHGATFSMTEVEINVPHDWESLELDGGTLGWYSIWRCRVCASTNGCSHFLGNGPDHDSFFACGCGPSVTSVSEDCALAKAFVEQHILVCPHSKCICGGRKSAHIDKRVSGGRTIREVNGCCGSFVLQTDFNKL